MKKQVALLMLMPFLSAPTFAAEDAVDSEQRSSPQEQRFDSLDADRDEVINKREAKEEIAENFGLIDQDDSGDVEFSEFSAWEEMNMTDE